MLKEQIQIGGFYLTRVSGALVSVVVKSATKDRNGRTRYVVAREDTGATLPKTRTPAALRLGGGQ